MATAAMSKSEAIREAKDAHPDWGPKRIAAELNKKKIKVTAQFVSTVLSNDRRKQGLTNRKKTVEDLSVQDLQVVKELVEKLGGIENAQTALNAYTQLFGD